ncbi:hypothetical protein, partial [Aurantibacter sp.]|uniref:hypothetical protein n=1 Tax=Aurantibacter sp. TaxID=2807103 RepID=UPI0035C85656
TTLNTESVQLDQLISFVADYFEKPVLDEDNEEDETVIKTEQVIFLIEASGYGFSKEDEIILQQAFKFINQRLTSEDNISIAFYSGKNGLLIKKESPKDIKKILHSLSHCKVIETYKDGIGESYVYANSILNPNARNTMVFVRNPNKSVKQSPIRIDENIVTETTKKSKNGTVVLLTAITLLPELINVLKD